LGRLGQPPVLGELLMGVLLGNLHLFGITALDSLRDNEMLRVTAEIGAILLLFEVGVESDLVQLLAVGWSSLLVATLGVIIPMVLGYAASAWLLPDASWLTHLFVGGTLTATSVGITARVLKDLGKSNTKEARIILGAAVADDVIGLVVLAVVSGLVHAVSTGSSGATASVNWLDIIWITVKASAFLVIAVVVGRFWSRRVFVHAARLRVAGTLLAPIVGAFAAGVVLEEFHYQPFRDRGERRVEELLFPITTLIVPVFFVAMGLRVDLSGFASVAVLKFAGLIALIAILGKQICGWGVLERGVNRIAVGVGMIPRGEVGLIFAGLGSSLILQGRPVLEPTTFSALVLVVMLTTFITPPVLKMVFARNGNGL